MTPEELNTLCKRIQDEQDPEGFGILIEKLNELLDATQKPRPAPNEQPDVAGERL